jgi:four helix bundle protein
LFPKDELFGLTSQLRRAVVSITSNIAEDFSRKSYKDKAHFYSTSLGSLTETQNQIIVARDVKYLTEDKFQEIAKQTVVVHKLLNGLIKCSRNHSIYNS